MAAMHLRTTTSIVSVLGLIGCSQRDGRDLRLSDLLQQEIGATIQTVGGYTPSPNPQMFVEFALPGSDPNGTSDADCAHLSTKVTVLINGLPAGGYRGGRAVNTWSGCDDSGYLSADVSAGLVDVVFSDGGDSATLQVEFALPTLASPADGLVHAEAQALVRLPTLPALPSARYTARLYALGDGPVNDLESSRPNGAPAPIDLEVSRDGDLLGVRMPSDQRGKWLLYISHPDRASNYEVPALRCDFPKCSAGLWDFYATFPAIQLELVE
jgi:hypothetical protein